MGTRLELSRELKKILGSDEVYYQRPHNRMMSYPAIVYKKENIYANYADDKTYLTQTQYEIMVMDTDPDSDIAERILGHFPYARANRRYEQDSIYHDVVIVYF